MMMLAWFLAVAAIGFQLLNVSYFIRSMRTGRHISQIHLVPVLLWYVALVLRGKGFFIISPGEEILWVFGIHIVLSLLMAAIEKSMR